MINGNLKSFRDTTGTRDSYVRIHTNTENFVNEQFYLGMKTYQRPDLWFSKIEKIWNKIIVCKIAIEFGRNKNRSKEILVREGIAPS